MGIHSGECDILRQPVGGTPNILHPQGGRPGAGTEETIIRRKLPQNGKAVTLRNQLAVKEQKGNQEIYSHSRETGVGSVGLEGGMKDASIRSFSLIVT